jgi:hypothetical protein
MKEWIIRKGAYTNIKASDDQNGPAFAIYILIYVYDDGLFP